MPGTNSTITSDVAVNVAADDSPEDLAARIVTAINNNFLLASAQAFGGIVRLTSVIDVNLLDASPPLPPFEGVGPGGKITGLAEIDNVLYAVSDAGGLYIVEGIGDIDNPSIGVPDAFLTFVAIPLTTGGDSIQFSGLSAGPENVEGGIYSNLLFATDSNGTVYAMNTSGVLQPIFLDGQTSVDTGVGGAVGVSFSTLDYNLWHGTDQHAGDPGHSGGEAQVVFTSASKTLLIQSLRSRTKRITSQRAKFTAHMICQAGPTAP